MDAQKNRRTNLRKLMDKEGATILGKRLGYSAPTFLSQMCGPNPTRKITEKSARRFERDLGMPEGSLDKDITEVGQYAGAIGLETVASVIRMVGAVCAEERIDIPPDRFADLAILAIRDTIEHEGRQRPEHIKQIVRLFK